MVENSPQAVPAPTSVSKLDLALDGYLVHLKVERSLSKNTLEAYARDLASFGEALGHIGLDDPSDVGTEHIADWVSSLARQGLLPSSQSRMLIAVRGFFRYLVRERVLSSDPARVLELPRRGRSLPELVAYEEVRALLEAAKASRRDRALILLLYGAGLRVTEVVKLDVNGVHLDAGVVRVVGKGDKERVVPIGGPIIDALSEYISTERPQLLRGHATNLLFPGRSGRRPFTRQAAFALLRRLARVAGIEGAVSPHKLRHGFATDLVRGGADLRSVQIMLGHADLRTTEIYTHVDDEHLRASYDRAHPRR